MVARACADGEQVFRYGRRAWPRLSATGGHAQLRWTADGLGLRFSIGGEGRTKRSLVRSP